MRQLLEWLAEVLILHPMLLCGERGSPYLRKPSGKGVAAVGGPAEMLSTV